MDTGRKNCMNLRIQIDKKFLAMSFPDDHRVSATNDRKQYKKLWSLWAECQPWAWPSADPSLSPASSEKDKVNLATVLFNFQNDLRSCLNVVDLKTFTRHNNFVTNWRQCRSWQINSCIKQQLTSQSYHQVERPECQVPRHRGSRAAGLRGRGRDDAHLGGGLRQGHQAQRLVLGLRGKTSSKDLEAKTKGQPSTLAVWSSGH